MKRLDEIRARLEAAEGPDVIVTNPSMLKDIRDLLEALEVAVDALDSIVVNTNHKEQDIADKISVTALKQVKAILNRNPGG